MCKVEVVERLASAQFHQDVDTTRNCASSLFQHCLRHERGCVCKIHGGCASLIVDDQITSPLSARTTHNNIHLSFRSTFQKYIRMIHHITLQTSL